MHEKSMSTRRGLGCGDVDEVGDGGADLELEGVVGDDGDAVLNEVGHETEKRTVTR